MKKIYAVFIGLFSLIALVWVLQLSLKGKPIAKIKISEFQRPKDLSEAILMRLRQEIKDHRIVLLGVDPEEPLHLEIWKEFLLQIKEPGWKFDEIYIEKNLPRLNANDFKPLTDKFIDIKLEEPSLKKQFENESKKNKRIALIVPHIYSSQLIKENTVQRLKVHPEDPQILSLTVVPLAETVEEEVAKRVPCVGEGADYSGESPLGCMIQNKARFWMLKKRVKNPEAHWGIVEQVGLNDYLVFFK